MEHTSIVRETLKWHMGRVWRWRQQQWPGRTAPYTKNGTHQQCEESLKVAHGRVWRWRQQQWEAVQGP
ncbi:unnamed protein product, partial [Staurois parvus]